VTPWQRFESSYIIVEEKQKERKQRNERKIKERNERKKEMKDTLA
jgi:hypothetical protein